MNFYRGIEDKKNQLRPDSPALSQGFINWPIHDAPKGNRYQWFKKQITPDGWALNKNYAMNERVSYEGVSYQAKRPIRLKAETPNFRPLPPLPPPGSKNDWEVLVAIIRNVTDLGTDWRKSTPGGLIATAATEGGAFSHMTYVYRITYPDSGLYCFSLNPKGDVRGPGAQLNSQGMLSRTPPYNQYLLIADVGTETDLNDDSKVHVVALYHGVVPTQEVTFLTPIPRDKFSGWKRTHDKAYYTDFSDAAVQKVLG
jgi:hypothetical protein